MTKVEKLEREVQKLSHTELAAFRDWFHEYDSNEWDRQIEEDVRAGKLDRLAEDALATRLGKPQRDKILRAVNSPYARIGLGR